MARADQQHGGRRKSKRDGQHGADQAHGDRDETVDHQAMMVADFRRRFGVSLILSVPVLLLAPMIQEVLGLWPRQTSASRSEPAPMSPWKPRTSS